MSARNVAEELVLLRRALAESLYVTHGPRGVASLRAQAPACAVLLQAFLDGSSPRNDTFVGRVETTVSPSPEEQR